MRQLIPLLVTTFVKCFTCRINYQLGKFVHMFTAHRRLLLNKLQAAGEGRSLLAQQRRNCSEVVSLRSTRALCQMSQNGYGHWAALTIASLSVFYTLVLISFKTYIRALMTDAQQYFSASIYSSKICMSPCIPIYIGPTAPACQVKKSTWGATWRVTEDVVTWPLNVESPPNVPTWWRFSSDGRTVTCLL